jgi:hypothetical protein
MPHAAVIYSKFSRAIIISIDPHQTIPKTPGPLPHSRMKLLSYLRTLRVRWPAMWTLLPFLLFRTRDSTVRRAWCGARIENGVCALLEVNSSRTCAVCLVKGQCHEI